MLLSTDAVMYTGIALSKDGAVINPDELKGSSESCPLEEGLITSFYINENDVTDGSEVVFPGGIMLKKSSAANVISVYGDSTADFSKTISEADGLKYIGHKNNNLSYSFLFAEDGTVTSASVYCEK